MATKLNHNHEVNKASDVRGRKYLASPLPGEEIVITGMAGCFPASDDIYHYLHNLKNKINMVSGDTRWKPTDSEVPPSAKISFSEKFDAGFFGVHHRQADSMDPKCRLLLERSVEAIMDAGINPQLLRGSNTGVFVGTCDSESERTLFYEQLESPSYSFTGCTPSMLAQQISNFFGLNGPSHTVHTACSSSLFAFEHAYRAIRMGRCDAAIVGASHMHLDPIEDLQLARLGLLSVDGCCKPFDEGGNGFVRSEAIAVLYLQKSKDAKRIYAQVIHCKGNCDGFKEDGITHPSGLMQSQLFKEMYQECNVDPGTVDFAEAHATGTIVGDPIEMNALDNVLCLNRKTPLYVGSVKSNLGHTEGASGISSLIKVLLCMENNCFLPNINYTRPRETMEGLKAGRMVVVTETTPWPTDGSGLAAVNCFGFGGSNCHVLLKRSMKQKINEGLPGDDLPRLVCVSGRTDDSVRCILDDIENRTLDVEYIGLLHEVYRTEIAGHAYKGYSVLSKSEELFRSISRNTEKRSLCLVFGNPKEKWLQIADQLLTIPLFAASIQRADNILSLKGISVMEIISKKGENDVTTTIVGHIATQIALVDTLKGVALETYYIIGYSIGELVAAYADGALTLEQTLLSGYMIGQCLNNQLNSLCYELESGKMASVTMDNKTYGTCQLGSVLTSHLGSQMLQHLKVLIVEPKERSRKWISSSMNEREEGSEVSNYASAEYFVDILTSPVLFSDAISMLPAKALLVEIGTEFLDPNYINKINLVEIEKPYVQSFLSGLGQIYQFGHDLSLNQLYPKVEWPVSVGTPMLSPIIKWDHHEDWYVAFSKGLEQIGSEERIVEYSIKEVNWTFMTGHVVDGNNLVPATAYIFLAWETFAKLKGLSMNAMQIVFENVKFLRTINIPQNDSLQLSCSIHKETGHFEVAQIGHVIVTGRLFIPDNFSEEVVDLTTPVGEPNTIAMTSKDINTELTLRGYSYTGAFCGLKQCDLNSANGLIEWTGNWIAFLENMLQFSYLQQDIRNLSVPTSIERLAIDARAHTSANMEFGDNPLLPIVAHKETDIIKCGAVEIRGFLANSIPRRKPLVEPVLESYKFIPFEDKLSTEHSVRVAMQLLTENHFGIKLRIVEVLDGKVDLDAPILGPIIHKVFGDVPQILAEIVLLSKQNVDIPNVIVEDKFLASENKSCSIVVVSCFLSRPETRVSVLNALKENGMILSRESLNFNSESYKYSSEFEILTVYESDREKLVLIGRGRNMDYSSTILIDMSDNFRFSWLPTLQDAIRNDRTVVLFAQNSPLSGILGLCNCLKHTLTGSKMKCFFIQDKNAPKFSISNSFYLNQLKKGLSMNVFKNGKWGSYRFMKQSEQIFVQREHVFNSVIDKGDLSKIKWIEGPFSSTSVLPPEKVLIQVYYSTINCKDIETGCINKQLVAEDRTTQYNVRGFGFSGRDLTGKRVMGVAVSGAFGTMVDADSSLIWDIPENISMEEAATIPFAYSTIVFSLLTIDKLKEGQSILIHDGTGGIGQATINVASYYKCNIFTTVGTQEGRDYIRNKYPQIPESHIGSSRDTSFEQMIYRQTHGAGVDLVLNSLSGEKFLASVRCLAPSGTFLEIGNVDLENNTIVGLQNFTEGRSIHGVMVDAFFDGESAVKRDIQNLLKKGLSAYIKPLPRVIFREDEVEEAFRYMGSGKQKGEIMIKFRDEESERNVIPKQKLYNGIPRFYGNPEKSYVITGGLGGFGLELANWLVLRGVRKLVLVSRTGVKTGYQAHRIRIWEGYGVVTKISTSDTTTSGGGVALLEEANKLGPVGAIFHLAVVLRDALIENQTEDNFLQCLNPKVVVMENLDVLSRKMCPHLDYFVAFSSLVCGRGNVGQENYGMANSIIERICEKRKSEGYPALAIQWGSIGEIGLLAEMVNLRKNFEVLGIAQQRLISCFEAMDIFLQQKEVVVSSMVTDKRAEVKGFSNIIDTVKDILGVRDLKTVSFYSPFSKLGVDSIMVVEIMLMLQNNFQVSLTPKDISSMTFDRLQQISTNVEADEPMVSSSEAMFRRSMGIFFEYMCCEEDATKPCLRMTSLIKENDLTPKIFLLPGLKGTANEFKALAANLNSHVVCFQYKFDEEKQTIEDVAKSLFLMVQNSLPKNTPFTLVGHSYGCIVALELASLLEGEGRIGSIVLINAAPAMLQKLMEQEMPEVLSDVALLQTLIVCTTLTIYIPEEMVMAYKDNIYNSKTFEERIDFVLDKVPKLPKTHFRRICRASLHHCNAILSYRPRFPKLKSSIKLFKSSTTTIENIDADYKLQDLTENRIEVTVYEGDHSTVMTNSKMHSEINAINASLE